MRTIKQNPPASRRPRGKTLEHKGTKKTPYCKPDAVKWLESTVYAAKVLRYQKDNPGIRTNFLVKQRFRDDTANGLTQCIASYIKLNDGQCERINVLGIFDKKLGRYRPSGSTRGSADLSATIHGRSVRIEIKIGRDRQSEYQKIYQAEIERSGGIYYVVKDFSSFKTWFDEKFGYINTCLSDRPLGQIINNQNYSL